MMEDQAAISDRERVAEHLMSRPGDWFASSDLVSVFNHIDQSQLDREGALTTRTGFHWRFEEIDIDQGTEGPGKNKVPRRRKFYRYSEEPCEGCCED